MTQEQKNTEVGASAPLVDEGSTYSKDYWDLVGEQLSKRALFKVGMAVLALLYGLAIFAPKRFAS